MTAIRRAPPADLAALSDLCMRSKAHWGYDQAFLDACRAELTLRPDDVAGTELAFIGSPARPDAMAQLGVDGREADLLKLFVDPGVMGRGYGRRLFRWAAEEARARGAAYMVIEADPGAVPFYRRMGARPAGTVPSGSIPGRELPRLILDLA